MKSIVCTEPNNMEIAQTENIDSVEENEVLIQIKRIGICGTDIHAYAGNQPFFTYPRILGHELSGIVKNVGNKVEHIVAGDTVATIPYMHCGTCIACCNGKTNCCTSMQVLGVHTDGGMAEYIKVPASHVMVVNELSLDDAAIIEPLSIGAHAIRRADIKEGETVLIIGAGPIGLGVARFAKLQGAKTIIMDLSEERLAYCKEWADCDALVQAAGNVQEQLLAVNNQELPSIVLDATGNKYSMTQAFDYAAHGGKLIYVGLVKDHITFFDPDFHSKELTLFASRNALKEDFEYVIQCMEQGKIKDGYITNRISFDEVVEFFAAGHFTTNKTVISVE